VGRSALTLRRLVAAVLIAASSLLPVTLNAANAFPKVVPALAVIALVGAGGKIVGFGTGFCIASDGHHSYFATNHHVIAAPGGAAPQIVAILTGDPGTRHPARVVADSKDPDLAILEIDVPNVPALVLSETTPETGDTVAIAGFPWNEGQLWGSLLGGQGFKLGIGARQFPPELQPSYHSGPVSAIHGGGQYYIQYDALTDHGNSGGPLFDPATGAVFGIVQATVPGMTDPLADTPPSVYNNLAISVHEGMTVLAKAPLPASPAGNAQAEPEPPGSAGANLGGAAFDAPPLDAAPGVGFNAQAVTRAPRASKACVAGSTALGRAYGAWSQAHGSLKSLEAFVAARPSAETRALLARISPAAVAQRGIGAEAAAVAELAASTRSLRSAGSTQSAKLAQTLVDAVDTATARDRKLAAGLSAWSPSGGVPYVPPPGLGSDKAAEAPLGVAADRVSSLLDCS
jgi:hypothetical protein